MAGEPAEVPNPEPSRDPGDGVPGGRGPEGPSNGIESHEAEVGQRAVAEPLSEARAKRPLPHVGSFSEVADGEAPVKARADVLVGLPRGFDSGRPRSRFPRATLEVRCTPENVFEPGQDRLGLVLAHTPGSRSLGSGAGRTKRPEPETAKRIRLLGREPETISEEGGPERGAAQSPLERLTGRHEAEQTSSEAQIQLLPWSNQAERVGIRLLAPEPPTLSRSWLSVRT